PRGTLRAQRPADGRGGSKGRGKRCVASSLKCSIVSGRDGNRFSRETERSEQQSACPQLRLRSVDVQFRQRLATLYPVTSLREKANPRAHIDRVPLPF